MKTFGKKTNRLLIPKTYKIESKFKKIDSHISASIFFLTTKNIVLPTIATNNIVK
jgi:hypothetical protein